MTAFEPLKSRCAKNTKEDKPSSKMQRTMRMQKARDVQTFHTPRTNHFTNPIGANQNE